MKTRSTILLILSLILISGVAQAWQFSVGICGTDQYYYRNRDADLWLHFTNLNHGAVFMVPLEAPEMNELTPIGPGGSYEEWLFYELNDTTHYAIDIYNATTDQYLESIGPIYSYYDGHLYNIVLAGNCDLAPVRPIYHEVHWDKPPVENHDTIKSGARDEPASWSTLKSSYR